MTKILIGLGVRQGKLIFLRDCSNSFIDTTQRNNQTVQSEFYNEHSAGSSEEAQSYCNSLPYLSESSWLYFTNRVTKVIHSSYLWFISS